jgi:elongation factor 1-alpha
MSKPYMQIVTMGHVDAGKSTTLAHLMYLTKGFSKAELEHLRRIATQHGRASFEFAYFFDQTEEERKRGVTIHLTRREYETDKYQIAFIDAAGHSDYITNTITGLAVAHHGILVVSARENEFLAGVKQGSFTGEKGGTTLEHARLAKVFGIKSLLVVVNKTDATASPYSEAQYGKVVERMKGYLTEVGFKPDQVKYIPISGLKGDNLTARGNLKWWKGDTLLQAINNFPHPEEFSLEKMALRVPIQKVLKVRGAGNVALGRVEYGTVRKGDIVTIMPFHQRAIVRSIERDHKPVTEACPPDGVGICLGGIQAHYVRHGAMVCNGGKLPLEVYSDGEIVARVVVMAHPKSIRVNYTPKMYIHTTSAPVRLIEIIRKIDEQNNVVESAPSFLLKGEMAEVRLVPQRPVAMDVFSEYPRLGRFALRDGNITVAAGIILKATAHIRKEE